MSPLRKKFEAEAKEYFAKYGYKRKRTSYGGFIYIKEEIKNARMLVFLNASSCNIANNLFTFPKVGVRYDDVERLIKILKPEANNEGATIYTPLGSLMPERIFLEYRYNEETNPDEFWNQMLQTIETYGKPYADKLSDIDTLISYIEDLGIGSAHQFEMPCLPVLYYLRGYDISRGLNYIERVQRVSPSLKENIFKDYYIEQYKKLYELKKRIE